MNFNLRFCLRLIMRGEVIHELFKEALALGGDVFVFELCQFTEQSLFLFAELFGHFDDDLHEQIAEAAAAGVGHAFAAELEDPAGLCAGGHFNASATVEFAAPIDPPVGRMIASGLAASADSLLYLGHAPGTSAVTEMPPARRIRSVTNASFPIV